MLTWVLVAQSSTVSLLKKSDRATLREPVEIWLEHVKPSYLNISWIERNKFNWYPTVVYEPFSWKLSFWVNFGYTYNITKQNWKDLEMVFN